MVLHMLFWMPQGRAAFSFCTGFAVSNLASPFGWEVGPLGLGGGELACGIVWSLGFGAVYLNGSRWAWWQSFGAIYVCKRLPPFRQAFACHLPPRGTAHLWLLLCSRWGGWRGWGQSIFVSEFSSSGTLLVPLPMCSWCLWRLCFLGCWRIIDIKKAPTPLWMPQFWLMSQRTSPTLVADRVGFFIFTYLSL